MKAKTYTLTQKEYNDFFSEDITVRRKKELAKKIAFRIEYFCELFDTVRDCDIDWEEIFLRHNEKQAPNSRLNPIYDYDPCFLQGCDFKYFLVKALWDDNYLSKLAKECLASNKREEKEAIEYEQKKTSILSKIKTVLTAEEQKFVKTVLLPRGGLNL